MSELYQFKTEGNVKPSFCEVSSVVSQGATPAFNQQTIIQNGKNWYSCPQFFIKYGDVVMFVEKLAYTKTTVTNCVLGPAVVAVAVERFTGLMLGHGVGGHDWKEAERLWNKNKSIPGGIYLHPNGKHLIWISDIDIKYFTKVEAEGFCVQHQQDVDYFERLK